MSVTVKLKSLYRALVDNLHLLNGPWKGVAPSEIKARSSKIVDRAIDSVEKKVERDSPEIALMRLLRAKADTQAAQELRWVLIERQFGYAAKTEKSRHQLLALKNDQEAAGRFVEQLHDKWKTKIAEHIDEDHARLQTIERMNLPTQFAAELRQWAISEYYALQGSDPLLAF